MKSKRALIDHVTNTSLDDKYPTSLNTIYFGLCSHMKIEYMCVCADLHTD